jgi:hypothetical protein
VSLYHRALALTLTRKASRVVCPVLFTNRGADLLQCAANGRDGLPSCPEVFTRAMALSSATLPGDGDGTLPLQAAEHSGHGLLWGDLEAYMPMLRPQVACKNAACLLTSPRREDWPHSCPPVAIQALPAPLGYTHHVIRAMPPRRRQALIGVRHAVLLRCVLIKPPEENSTPGSLKAVQVSLVKPVAYLKDRVTELRYTANSATWCTRVF